MNRTMSRADQRERVAFAGRQRQARAAAGHDTMEAAARAAGIRSGVYWRHENGKQGITLEFVRLYARAFGVRPCWLAFGTLGFLELSHDLRRHSIKPDRRSAPLLGHRRPAAILELLP